MTPDEEFNIAIWLVLQKIRRLYLYTKNGDSISYLIEPNGIIPFPDDETYIAEDEQLAILDKLVEQKAITKLIPILGPSPDSVEFTFNLIQPAFDELYKQSENNNSSSVVKTERGPDSSSKKIKSFTDTKAVSQKSAGSLAFFSDGSIRIENEVIPMRSQLKILCRMFIGRPNDLILVDEMKEELINHDKTVPNETISKYVGELRKILKDYSFEGFISNTKKEGWTLVLKK